MFGQRAYLLKLGNTSSLSQPERLFDHSAIRSDQLTLEDAVSSYGRAVKAKLSAIIHGEPEDQLRNPLERLLTDLVQLSALDPQRLTLVGETLISTLRRDQTSQLAMPTS
jgi:hypothetical protein